MMSFSIVIPLYNKASIIEQTLNSVLRQTYTRFEIVIIDDGSTDRGVDIVSKFNDQRIRLIQKENGGVSSARNVGIEHANYEYIAFLDADDSWEPEYLANQKDLIEEFPEAAIWGCAWGYMKNGEKQQIDHALRPSFRGIIHDYWGMKKKSNIFWSSAVVVKKDVFKKVGLFDQRIRLGEDLDMWYRIILEYPVVFYNKTLAWYHQDAENRAMDKQSPLNFMLPYYIEKYKTARDKNPAFKKYFDAVCLGRVYPYLLNGQNKNETQRILKQIDFSLQPLRKRLKFAFPRFSNFIIKRLTLLR